MPDFGSQQIALPVTPKTLANHPLTNRHRILLILQRPPHRVPIRIDEHPHRARAHPRHHQILVLPVDLEHERLDGLVVHDLVDGHDLKGDGLLEVDDAEELFVGDAEGLADASGDEAALKGNFLGIR